MLQSFLHLLHNTSLVDHMIPSTGFYMLWWCCWAWKLIYLVPDLYACGWEIHHIIMSFILVMCSYSYAIYSKVILSIIVFLLLLSNNSFLSFIYSHKYYNLWKIYFFYFFFLSVKWVYLKICTRWLFKAEIVGEGIGSLN